MRRKRNQPKVLLFDLGGVIVRWVGIDALAKLGNTTPDAVKTALGRSKIAHQYERGFGSNAMFLKELIRMFDLDISQSEMKSLWNSWVQNPYEDITHKILNLHNNFTTACLSNTNAMHWAHLNNYLPCDDIFHHVYASHLIHQAKPEEACYRHVCEDMGVSPSDIWFFDDTNENVLAAQKLGMTALKVDPKFGVIPVLEKFGLV